MINPHITVGKLDDAQTLNKVFEHIRNVDDKFIAVVNKISVEMIGKNEESIIVIEKQLFLQLLDNFVCNSIANLMKHYFIILTVISHKI